VRAAGLYVSRHPHLAPADQRFDVIFLAPFAWPRHIINAFDAT
jgi:putative endonuclease